jgi:hypothetical protein
MASTINASSTGSGGLITTGDASGQLALQANGVTQATVSSSGLAMATNQTISTANTYGFKNRLINGQMQIDQRTAGAVSTPVNNTYPSVDRYKYYLGAASKCTTQQLTASPPANFTSYLNITSTSAYTVGASESFFITQIIEGFNVADLGWGTANAKSVTLSFWVQSSLTGTFGGAVVNYGQTTNWTFAYTITAANTWQQVSVTLTGPTTGSWSLGTNSPSMYVAFSFAAGSSAQGAASTSWATVGAGVFAPTGQVNLVGTNGATWNITGIQLEVGSQATSFDFRSIGTELALCQRYFQSRAGYNVVMGSRYSTNLLFFSYALPVVMRTTPTVSNASGWSALNATASESSGGSTLYAVSTSTGGNVDVIINSSFNPAGYVYIIDHSSTTVPTLFSAEL